MEKEKLKCITAATLNEEVQFDRKFLGAVLRKVQAQCLGEAELEAARQKGYQAGVKTQMDNAAYEIKRVRDDFKGLTETVEAFEKASGVFIRHGWNGGEIGDAVRQVRCGVHLRQMNEMERIAEAACRVTATVEEELSKLKAAPGLTLAGSSIQS